MMVDHVICALRLLIVVVVLTLSLSISVTVAQRTSNIRDAEDIVEWYEMLGTNLLKILSLNNSFEDSKVSEAPVQELALSLQCRMSFVASRNFLFSVLK